MSCRLAINERRFSLLFFRHRYYHLSNGDLLHNYRRRTGSTCTGRRSSLIVEKRQQDKEYRRLSSSSSSPLPSSSGSSGDNSSSTRENRSNNGSRKKEWWWSRASTAVWNVFRGVDDKRNPKKLLERRYLYYALLALELRSLRHCLQQPLQHNDGSENAMSGDDDKDEDNLKVPSADISSDSNDANNKKKSDLYDMAVDKLETQNLDGMSNVDLRIAVQKILDPAIQEIFRTFATCDAKLLPSKEDGVDDAGVFGPNFDWDPYKTILVEEHEIVCAEIMEIMDRLTGEEKRALTATTTLTAQFASSLSFLRRKQQAIETLLSFHGWSSSVPPSLLANDQFGVHNDQPELDAFGFPIIGNDANSKRRLTLMRQYQTVNVCRSALIRQQIGYSVLVLKSLIPGAGRGVFVDGSCKAGSIVAFMPGEVWPKEHLLTKSADVLAHFDDDDGAEDQHQITMRFDDFCIDSRISPVTVLSNAGSMNPWAVAHMINHPPLPSSVAAHEQGNGSDKAKLRYVLPNCQSTMLNYTEGVFLQKSKMLHGDSNNNNNNQLPLLPYIPNTYAREPTWLGRFFDSEPVLMHGMCLLARCDVTDTELLYDYRLQSDDTPAWYSVVKYNDGFDDDQPQVVFFRDDWKQQPNISKESRNKNKE